jgi:hypothetical protein
MRNPKPAIVGSKMMQSSLSGAMVSTFAAVSLFIFGLISPSRFGEDWGKIKGVFPSLPVLPCGSKKACWWIIHRDELDT